MKGTQIGGLFIMFVALIVSMFVMVSAANKTDMPTQPSEEESITKGTESQNELPTPPAEESKTESSEEEPQLREVRKEIRKERDEISLSVLLYADEEIEIRFYVDVKTEDAEYYSDILEACAKPDYAAKDAEDLTALMMKLDPYIVWQSVQTREMFSNAFRPASPEEAAELVQMLVPTM